MFSKKNLILIILPLAFLIGCAEIPDNVQAVNGFDLKKFTGTWYEIARLDHYFERDLTAKVTAEYALMEDGGIQIRNRGMNPKTGEWKEANGKGYPVGKPDVGRLKVSFYVPVYFGYNVIDLDKENYRYALICGRSRSELWILSRDPVLDDKILRGLVEKAKLLGFETDKLIWVNQK